MTIRAAMTWLALLLAYGAAAGSAEPDPHEQDRKALLNVFHEIEAGINDQNVDRMVAQMHPAATTPESGA